MATLKAEKPITLPNWWYIIPTYLAVWSTVFGLWGYFGGQAAFDAFGLEVSAHPFIYGVYGARYVGIAAGLWLALFLFRTEKAILTMLIVRLIMDVLDTIVGFQTGMMALNITNLLTPFVMFLAPNLFSIWYLYRAGRSQA